MTLEKDGLSIISSLHQKNVKETYSLGGKNICTIVMVSVLTLFLSTTDTTFLLEFSVDDLKIQYY